MVCKKDVKTSDIALRKWMIMFCCQASTSIPNMISRKGIRYLVKCQGCMKPPKPERDYRKRKWCIAARDARYVSMNKARYSTVRYGNVV